MTASSDPNLTVMSCTVAIAVAATDPETGRRHILETIEPGQIPAERLAYWARQSNDDRGGLIAPHVATLRTSTTLDTTGWEHPGDLNDPVPDLSRKQQP